MSPRVRASDLRRLPALPLIGLIDVYRRLVSPLFGPRCRFVPSCSEYAVEALRRHGAIKGGALTVWRLLRCQPFCHGGYDPVPPRRDPHAGAPDPALPAPDHAPVAPVRRA